MVRRQLKNNASGRFVIGLKERREKALQLRIDGYSLRQIAEETGIDAADLCRYFQAYKSESIKALHEELFEQQSQRLMELWRNASADMRKFVPVMDAKGNAMLVPVLDADGQPVLDEAGQPIAEYMRDFGVHLNAVNVAARITEKIAAHFGLDAPAKNLMLTERNGDREIIFRIVDGVDGRLVEPTEQIVTTAQDAELDSIADALGADNVVSNVINGVEVVSFSIPEPSELKYHG